jgi:hypothetical protein
VGEGFGISQAALIFIFGAVYIEPNREIFF